MFCVRNHCGKAICDCCSKAKKKKKLQKAYNTFLLSLVDNTSSQIAVQTISRYNCPTGNLKRQNEIKTQTFTFHQKNRLFFYQAPKKSYTL